MKPSLKSLAEATAEEYEVDYLEMVGASRRKVFTEPRHVFFFIANRKVGHSSSQIGRFTERCHSTVIHAIRKTKHRVSRYKSDIIIERAQELDAHKKAKIRKLIEEGWK
jgi:chromosomal replication initiation ATPase DnaA